MAITTITLDTYKQKIDSNDAFNLSDSFNGRVGDEQVPLLIKYKERGIIQQFDDDLVPFMSGFVGNLDEDGIVTADTGEAVSYHGSRDDIMGLGKVKMNLPGTIFPQEGYFYGFLGLETADHSKRVTTFSVWFHVYNGNPDMFVNKEPFRSELQKVLDAAQALLDKTDGDIKTKLQEWQDEVNQLIKDKNVDLDNLNERFSLASDRLTVLETKIKQDGLLTQGDLDNILEPLMAKIDDLINQDFNVVPKADISTDEVSNTIDDFIGKIDSSKFNLTVITDSHYQDMYTITGDWIDYPFASSGLNRLTNFLKIAGNTDFAIANGDNTGGNFGNRDRAYGDLSLYSDELLFGRPKANIGLIAGNHDDGSPTAYKNPSQVLTEADMKEIYQTDMLHFGEIRNGDSLYFYKDFDDKKIRVIALWSEDVPETVIDGNGYQQYPRWIWHGYRQKQLDWLATIALRMPADYQALVITHAPIVGSGYQSNDKNAHFVNNDLVEGILNAFIQGSSFSQNNSDQQVGTGFGANIAVDFSTQGPHKLIGFFNGHTHREELDLMDHFKQVHLLNDVTLEQKDVGTTNAGAITVISVDTKNQRVKLLGWGRATDRSFSY